LYNQRKGYVPIFGKGMLGGVDAADQEREVDKYIKAVEKFQDKISTETGGGKAENINKPKLVNRYTRIEAEGKNMYKRPEDMSERDWKIFRENNDIRVISGKSVAPIREFGDGDLNLRIVKNIEAIGYKKPTPIQMQGITMGLARKDMIGLAPTGSGKSAAFLIPMIHYLIPLTKLTRDRPDEGPHGIVLSPTRELTMQIQEEFQKLTVGLGMKSALLIGGHDSNDQEDLINIGIDVIFATPGRLHDLLNKSLISLDRCNYVVIDEADLMIDLGLEEDLHEILSTIPRSNLKSTIPELAAQQEIQAAKRHDPFRTTHMFSATMPRSLRSIAQK
jgi:ATP-dependent RNA helicase DDX23/PRP28